MSLKRAASIVVLLAVVGAVVFYYRDTGGVTPPAPPAAGPPVASGGAPASSAVQLELVSGTAKANNAPANTGDFYQGPSNDPIAMKWVQLSAGAAGGLNPIVHNGAGLTLYRFDKDSANPPKSTCDGTCATTWQPVLIQPTSRLFLDGVAASDVGTVTRSDGSKQVTIGKWPVYRYSKDTKSGDINGQGVGGTWFAVAPDGSKAGKPAGGTDIATGLQYKIGTAQQNNAPANTGDFYKGPSNNPAAMKWVQLTAGSAGGLNPIVHNGAGLTLYRFDKDTAKPSKSACTGACLTTWQPVLVTQGSRIFVDGVSTAQVGILNRPDGTRQVTLAGWPLYKYTKDTQPGDINGENVGGTWFAISPQGKKVAPK